MFSIIQQIDYSKYDTPEKRDSIRAILQAYLARMGEFGPEMQIIFLSSFLARESSSARVMIDSGIAENCLVGIDYSDQGQIPFCKKNFPKMNAIASSWDDGIASLPRDRNGFLKKVAIAHFDSMEMPETESLLNTVHKSMNLCGKDVMFIVNTVLRSRHRNYNGAEGAPGISGAGRKQFLLSLREKMGPDGDRWFSIEPRWNVYRQRTAKQDMGIYLFWSAS